MKKYLLLLLLLMHSLFSKEIIFWHAFEGFVLEKFTELVNDFNHQSGTYQIKLVYQGNYSQIFEKGIEAFKQGHPPHILQVAEFATQTMTLMPHLYRPVDELMRNFYKKFDPAVYIDVVRNFYSTSDGKMYSLPWNASTGILFYNKNAFKNAGLDPENPPKTWPEVECVGIALTKNGLKGFTTAWPAAYHLELLCAWHNLPFATCENGFTGLDARLIFNQKYQIRHVEKLSEWQKNGVFTYLGRFNTEPEKAFTEGKCGILLQGANRFPILKKMTQETIGVGFMPYWPDIEGSPYALTIGGTSFWAIRGFDEETYRGIAQFFSYLSMPEVQAYWHEQTGYLPLTEAAYYLTKKRGFYANNPAQEIAVLEVMSPKITPNTKGIRLGNYPLVREKIIDNLEKAFNGTYTPKEALDKAVEEGNQIIADFESTHS